VQVSREDFYFYLPKDIDYDERDNNE